MAQGIYFTEAVEVDYVAPAALVAGQVIAQGNLVGAVAAPTAIGKTAGLLVSGICDFLKAGGLAINAGDLTYWDDTLLVANKTSGVKALGTLTISVGVPSDAETVTIGGRVYTWKTTPLLPDAVDKGTTIATACTNLANAINNGTFGSLPNALVSADGSSGTTVVITAINYGTSGNAITTTETMTNGAWGTATLASGAGGAKIGKCVLAAASGDATVRVKVKA